MPYISRKPNVKQSARFVEPVQMIPKPKDIELFARGIPVRT